MLCLSKCPSHLTGCMQPLRALQSGFLPALYLSRYSLFSRLRTALVAFYFTVLPSVSQSVSIRIMICPVNTVLVSLVAKTFRKIRKKTDPAAKTMNYFCILP